METMKIPDEVKINGFLWKVVKDANVAREGDVFGSIHMATQKIFLDPESTQQKQEQCFLHECLHAVSWQTGLTRRLDNRKLEEEIITALSFGIYQVLKDNGLIDPLNS